MPIVDGGVELDAGICGGPGGIADLVPEFAGVDGLHRLACGARGERPILLRVHGLEELVRDADRVVRVLARNGEVGFAVPIGIEDGELDVAEALLCELDDAQDVVVRHVVAARFLDGALQGGLRAGSKQRSSRLPSVAPLSRSQLTQAFMMALRRFWQMREPVTRAATFCSSRTFQVMYSSISG